ADLRGSHPREVLQGLADEPTVVRADHRVRACEERPADEAVADRQHHWLLRMIAGDLRNPLIAPLVVGPRVIAVPRPQETHRVLRKVRPPPGPRVLRLQVVVERSVLLVRL